MSRNVLTQLAVFFLMPSVLCCCGCDLLYRMLQKEGAQERELLGDLIPSQENPAVKDVQKLLKLYGYNPGPIDGKLGTNTRMAVARFQEDNGLKATRFIDQPTWNQLHKFEASGLVKNGEIQYHQLQFALKNAGFFPGRMDGKFGPKTLKAIADFQRQNNLKADGAVGVKTLSSLVKYLMPEKDSTRH